MVLNENGKIKSLTQRPCSMHILNIRSLFQRLVVLELFKTKVTQIFFWQDNTFFPSLILRNGKAIFKTLSRKTLAQGRDICHRVVKVWQTYEQLAACEWDMLGSFNSR